jgi:hypothetical protein
MGDTLWIVTILLVHFVADFVVQTRWQTENKSKDWGALVSHVGTYWAFLHLFAVALVRLVCLGRRQWRASLCHGRHHKPTDG